MRAKPPANNGTTLATRRRLNAWHRGHTLEHALLELTAALLRVTLRAEIEGQHREVFRVESRTDSLRVLKAAQEQAGAHERDERERDLRRHQQVAQAEQSIRSRGSPGLFLQLADQVGPRGLNRRREPEDHAGRHGHREREQQHPHIRLQIDRIDGEEGRAERPQETLCPERQQQTGRAAEQRE